MVVFMPFLGLVHLFDWDEINFAEAAREMIVSGNYSTVTINFEPFWEKPPLFIWMQALSMRIFGINEFAARFPTVLASIATINLIYFIGVKHFRANVAMLWVLAYLGSIAPHFYFRTGLIDPTFNLFIFVAVYQMALAYSHYKEGLNNSLNVVIAALFIGLAVLTKGPVVLVICGLVFFVLCFFTRKLFIRIPALILGIIILTGVSSLWLLPETLKNGPWFISRFITYQMELFSQNVAGHQQPFYYHPLVLFFGCFPAIFFAIKAMSLRIESFREKPFFITFHILFWVVLILFSIVKTKIVHYSSLCWLPLTFMAAFWIDAYFSDEVRMKRWQHFFLFLSGLPWLVLLFALPFLDGLKANNPLVLEYVKDPFVLAILETPYHFGIARLVCISIAGVLVLIALFATFYKPKNVLKLFMANGIAVWIVAYCALPVVDMKLQGDLFSFYEQISKKDAYVETVHFKSYAHYFYAQVKPPKSTDGLTIMSNKFLNGKAIQDLSADSFKKYNELKQGYLMDAKCDKPVYAIFKVGDENLPKPEQGFFSLGKKGAYRVFYKPKNKD